MFRVLLLCACVAVSLALDLDRNWADYKSFHGKQYSKEEEPFRRAIWEKNLNIIQQHNIEYDMGLHTFSLGMNEYGDLTVEEFHKYLLTYRQLNRTAGATFVAPENFESPASEDWRKKGYVTPIKNQGQCGSCWAFSATGSLEGQHFRKTKKLVSLSEQNLVDCSRAEGNMGCGGGLMDQAFDYIKKNNGIDTEESYPYEARDGKCRFNPNTIGATLTGYTDIKRGDENALKKAVASVGPISVAIDASGSKFQLYKHGIFNNEACSSTRLDHGVLAVGYGTQDGGAFWLVKNSWGESWGMKGYIMMSRNKDNQCGIATQASYPLV